ncbi:hypothetical protein ScFU53_07580 [Streptococcus canis]|uniref:pneumococcal-type histidine triad protein n=1 Tax=Streptococcus canis TaxID=1329 RepID=UPI00138832F0|nr:pneumococcal-type histidine triad protein [Streptococcus canis]GFG43746.1 hypothetical protein ScFU53_07580 [Streptococcus canis]
MSKRIFLRILLIFALCGLTACHKQVMDSSTSKSDKTSQHSSSKENTVKDEKDKTPNQINQEEGIAAEQIVVSISDDGFVTSHGGHYHFYNGEVPFDSLLSSDLLAPKDYQFDAKQVVNEINNGYIVKVDGAYYVYLNDSNHQENIRMVTEK